MGVEKEYFTGLLLEDPVPSGSFLAESVDLSAFSDGKILHYAEAGVEPEVLVNNDTYPVGIQKREDMPHEIPMDTYDTKNTQHTNLEKSEESPDKGRSIVRGHKSAIHKRKQRVAAFNWSPTKNSPTTPVLETTGASVEAGGVTRKRLCFADIVAMETRFRMLELDSQDLVLLLSASHLEDLQLQDIERYRSAMTNGKIGMFKIYNSNFTPTYSAATGEKEAFGAAKTANSMTSSIVWAKEYVMRAEGEVKAFVKENDPEYRGDILGFQSRFSALPLRNTGIGAIYSAKV